MSESSESIPAPSSASSGQPVNLPPLSPSAMQQPQMSQPPLSQSQMAPPPVPPTMAYPAPNPTMATPQPPQNPAYAYTPYQSYGYPYPYPPVPQQVLPRGMAITGMVLGIVGLVTAIFYVGGVIGIVGLVFSIIALRATGRREAGGRGMAIAGLVTSIIAIIINAIEIILIIWVVHTVNNCSQYDPNTNPNGSITQYNDCVRQGILGN